MPQTILIVDDDPTQRRLLEAVVKRHGYETKLATGGEEAVALLGGDEPGVDLVLLDLVMPDLDGLKVLEQVKPKHPLLPVIVLTAKSGVDTIVNVMRAGGTDFIVKPASPERLQVSIENALKMNVLTGEISRLTRQISNEMGFRDLIAESPAMRAVIDLSRRAADSGIPVLIEGESGVGKEMVARAVQGSGDRAGKPFVAVNCGAIPDNLVESILFGHEKGAFTGASDKHIGKFVEADGGTLFLDEVGELRPDIQVKLLRALQEGEVDPVGGKRPTKIDIRLISATNRNLYELVNEGKFREDLYYRLSVFPIAVPPLRDRREDIEPLVRHFLARFSATEAKPIRGVGQDAMQLLLDYRWPGNVRQLENAVFRAVVLCDDETLAVGDFPQLAQAMGVQAAAAPAEAAPPPMAAQPLQMSSGEEPVAGAAAVVTAAPTNGAAHGGNGADLPVFEPGGHVRKLEEVENDLIKLAIKKYNGQMSEVARRLGIGRSTLYRKVRDLGLDVRGAPD
ncbi:MAG: sigma-54 dependent transcriptional regulator [Alphaproteobacteria bacterium]